MTPHQAKWKHYHDTRRADYPFRCGTRYKGVADQLFRMGLNDGHILRDVGAGSCQFGQYLRERGWFGHYAPVDAVLDGVDLEHYVARPADFIVCIEVVEHLSDPFRLIESMRRAAFRGLVLTTPNSERVDVINCDPTHISVVPGRVLARQGFTVSTHTWFGVADDTLMAWVETYRRQPRPWVFDAL